MSKLGGGQSYHLGTSIDGNKQTNKSLKKSLLSLAEEARKWKPSNTENLETLSALFQPHFIWKTPGTIPFHHIHTTLHHSSYGWYQRMPSREPGLSTFPGANNLLSVRTHKHMRNLHFYPFQVVMRHPFPSCWSGVSRGLVRSLEFHTHPTMRWSSTLEWQ